MALSVVSSFFDVKFKKTDLTNNLVQGFLFGATAIVGMLYPFVLTKGIIFDGRSIVISLCTLFFGPISGVIASLMAIAYRIYIGGSGALMGTLVITSSFFIGFIFYLRKNKNPNVKLSIAQLYLFGLIVHITMILLMFSLPSKNIYAALKTISLTVILVYPVVTLLIGKIMLDHERNNYFIKKLKESEERFRHSFDHSGIGVCIIGTDKKFQKINGVFKEILGYDENEIISYTFNDITFPNDIPIGESVVSRLLSGELDNSFFEKRYVRKDGEVITCQVSTSLVRDVNNKPQFFITHLIDITKAKKAELELQQHQNDLELLVKERTEELDSINKELVSEIEKKKDAEEQLKNSLEKEKELSQLKSRFISTASHEFRTPLSAVLSSAELIQRFGKTWPEEKFNEHILRIISSVDYLSGLMDDVLTVNRSEAGKTKIILQPTNFYNLCLRVVEDVQSNLSANYQLVFNYHLTQKEFNLDSKQIYTSLLNLISNAIKYSPDGGKIELNVSDGGEYLFISIKDEGIGIPPEDIPNLFEPFHRSQNVGEIRGTGLGLSIAKNSINLHNGKISVDSTLGKGTTFNIYLPKNLVEENS